MDIEKIDVQELCKMSGKEGLVLQGCGGDLKEWVDGINKMLKEDDVLLEDTEFEHAFVFEHEDTTCLLFPFENVKLDIGKFAVWRLETHEAFGGIWLSDYAPNKLGGFVSERTTKARQKPDCPLIGADSNIFNLMGIASRTLCRNGMAQEAKEMCAKVMQFKDYYGALGVIGDYVNITSASEDDISVEEGMHM